MMKPEWTALHYAVTESDDLEAVRVALTSEVAVDARTNDKYAATALHRAAGHGRIPGVVGLLVDAGADIEAKNFKGRTPLHLAYRYGAPQWLVAELVACGASEDAIDDGGFRPRDLLDPKNH